MVCNVMTIFATPSGRLIIKHQSPVSVLYFIISNEHCKPKPFHVTIILCTHSSGTLNATVKRLVHKFTPFLNGRPLTLYTYVTIPGDLLLLLVNKKW